MPCSTAPVLQSDKDKKGDKMVLTKKDLLGQEGIPLKENVKIDTSSDDEKQDEQRLQKGKETKDNESLSKEKGRNIYNISVLRRNEDENNDVRKNDGLNQALTKIDHDNTHDKNILFIVVESQMAQVGNNNHVMIQAKQRKSLVSSSEESAIDLHMSTRTKKERGRGGKGRRRPRSRSNPEHVRPVPPNLPPAAPSASYLELCRISDDVMLQLQVVRDNAEWDVFDTIIVTLSRKYQSKEAEIVILLEKGMALCYQSRLEESKDMILQAIDIAKETENSCVLTGRGLHYLSGVYRRESLTGKADDCVIKSQQNFHNKHLTLDSTFLAYERASVLMDFISKCPNPPASMINDATAGLIECIDGCVALEDDTGIPRYVKKHHFAFIKRAMLLLDCRTAQGRKRAVSQERIKEAEKSLQTLKTRYWDGISVGEKVQYFLGLADLYFRLEDFPKAEENANKALNMAKKYGFNTEIKPAQDRLEEIRKQQQKKESCFHGYREDVYTSADNSESLNDDLTSSESDFMETPSYY